MSAGSVYAGFWYISTKGRSAWTLTLPDDAAFTALSALAVLMALTFSYLWDVVRSPFWKIVPRTFHRADLCKPGGPAATLWHMIRTINREGFHKSLISGPLIIISLILGALAASILGPWGLTDNGSETVVVRASGSSCYMWKPAFGTVRSALTRNLNLTFTASDYHQTCYQENTPLRCQTTLMTGSIPWDKTVVDCPFAPEICFQETSIPGSETWGFETPNISMDDLGDNTNLPLKLNRALTCTVLNRTAFERPVLALENKPLMNLSFGTV